MKNKNDLTWWALIFYEDEDPFNHIDILICTMDVVDYELNPSVVASQ